MKKLVLFTAAIAFLATSCRKIEADTVIVGGGGSNNNEVTESTLLEGKISKDRTLKAGNTYTIRGIVYVTNGAKLTIEPGTVVRGETSSKGALVITRGSQIIADGTKEKPIVFTSDASSPKRGDWGGIVICGNAPTNSSFNGTQGVGQVEGGVNNGEGLGLYGGNNATDNSGILRYVRIEYAGYAYLPDNELNSLTLAGVGSGTTVDYVEIFKANDDAIECFGGTVNLRHTVFISTLDDDFDTDNGYSGTVQFGIVVRDSAIADISKSESWESDNDANGSALLPQTSAVYSNITVIGPRAAKTNVGNSLYLAGAQIRRNSTISIHNSVIMGYPTGVLIDASKGVPTDNNIKAGTLAITNTVVAGCAKPVDYSASSTPTGWSAQDAINWFSTAAFGNTILNTNDEVKLTAAFKYSSPDVTPLAGSPLLTGAAFTMNRASAFTQVSFRGAVGAAGTPEGEWWKGWTKLDLSL
ncbi:hypothetical protein SAMN05660909_03699 [Chitinophaga terrae (ex Kim and Jung 2007)]|uniref:T9SS C-terminal target domain-containing protein n=1 Tax=Chitinophaga terrae (ex Kim and Jung 2007) TaxID=408074 RepID=A0A1H4EI59_9BACT|nr:hypothetical protein [Chitinophaga terrae (ex Kim and Jung 2007)]MDQ0109586.1 carbonic anhydrase/acetyltransferase-like protein (isoleucine patch superfamily) [Chitinophaga terrae (ex Kim and Jung 2007)]GEP91612.1 hypothetical protein CTE07_32570 [Chitinophaga terrae (ex Kim and Jung 2007)]SEA83912.1 hypothetical protein SAMN05660909_03699 [Chitinophaga terrae (ex Kim and Jung 2007)]